MDKLLKEVYEIALYLSFLVSAIYLNMAFWATNPTYSRTELLHVSMAFSLLIIAARKSVHVDTR